MFSTFKKLFGRQEAAVMQPPAPPPRLAPPVQRARTESSLRPQPNVSGVLGVSIVSIIARLPKELTQRVTQADAGGAEIAIPLQRILSQIATGAVRITFGELRQAAPLGTFSHENDRDRASVDIPLNEILPRIDHSLFPRRAGQRQVVVPNEVVGPFGGQTQISFTTAPLKGGTTVQPAAPNGGTSRLYRRDAAPAPVAPAPIAPVPVAAPAPAPMPRITVPQPSPVAPAPVPAPAPAVRIAAPKPAVTPSAPIRPAAPQAAPAPKQAPVIVPFQPAAKPAPAPAPAPMPARPAYAFQPSNGHAHAAPPVRPVAPPPNVVPFQPAFAPEAEPFPIPSLTPALPVEDGADQETLQFTAPEETVPESPLSFTPPAARQQPTPHYQASPAAPAPVAPLITPITPEPDEPAPIRFNPPPELARAAAVPAPIPAPAPAPAAMPSIAGETRFLTLAISAVGGSWPTPIQQEIMAHQMTSSSVALPFGVIELALKQGKVALPWRVLRSWIKPLLQITTSPNDAVMVELPLKIIAPLFMAEMKSGRPQKKVSVDNEIPELFSSRIPTEPSGPVVPGVLGYASAPAAPPLAPLQPPQPAPISAIPSRTTPDTNYFARPNGDHPEESAPLVKKGSSPGTAFLQRYATPNEIVAKAAALDGVEGAIIALPDGLQVASHVPANMNADTIAGFLPQIFNRISQCTKELRMGELNNLSFTVGNVPWKMFKVGAIFFAAFGRPGSALPTAQLAGIAAELDRKPK